MIGTVRHAPIGAARAAARRVVTWSCLAAALALALPAAAAAASPEGGTAVTATGTITAVKASERTITVKLAGGEEARFVWDSDTRITGVLTPGARVTVRYVDEGGRNRALQITVARA